jgi:hypothetical protein
MNDFPRCTKCGHSWHGLPCPVLAGTQCLCPSAYTEEDE